MRQRFFWSVLVLALLVIFPLVAPWFDFEFYVSYVRRVLIFALAATGLNLVLGYGGMVALGHAAFFGAGAYAVVILAGANVHSAFIVWPAAAALSAVLALAVGAVSLRTRGVYFIMITLAFAQMVYYVFISLRQYGGDDGINLSSRTSLPGIDTGNDTVFYYLVLAVFVLVLYYFGRLVRSRFGMALTGIRENEIRMESLGYPVYRLKLMAFTISGAMLGLAGAMLADHNLFVSPGMMHWTQSANLLIMVLIGGMGLRYGGVVGAALLLFLEEGLRLWTEFWHMPLGFLLLLIVFFAPKGLASLWSSSSRRIPAATADKKVTT